MVDGRRLKYKGVDRTGKNKKFATGLFISGGDVTFGCLYARRFTLYN
jgi:hypothetical protein